MPTMSEALKQAIREAAEAVGRSVNKKSDHLDSVITTIIEGLITSHVRSAFERLGRELAEVQQSHAEQIQDMARDHKNELASADRIESGLRKELEEAKAQLEHAEQRRVDMAERLRLALSLPSARIADVEDGLKLIREGLAIWTMHDLPRANSVPAHSEDAEKRAREIIQKISGAAIELAFVRHSLTSDEIDVDADAPIKEQVAANEAFCEEVKTDVLQCLSGDDSGCLDPDELNETNCELLWLISRIAAELAVPAVQPPSIPDRLIARIEQRTGRDCLRCCVAMVTQVNYEDVPDFCAEHGESWPSALGEWLDMLGMGLLMFGKAAPEYVPSWLPIIAQGKTNRSSLLHFVVITSDDVIDPSPYQSGLTEITDRYAIVNSGALANNFIEHIGQRLSETSAALREARSAAPRVADEREVWDKAIRIVQSLSQKVYSGEAGAPTIVRALKAARDKKGGK
jgi:hypothetical protein